MLISVHIHLTIFILAGPKKLTLLVQNEQDADLKMNITIGSSTDNHSPPYEIRGHGTEQV